VVSAIVLLVGVAGRVHGVGQVLDAGHVDE
jgi:hypothetical protein